MITALKILWGVLTGCCIAGAIWLIVIGIWQGAIPLGALALLFGVMTVRDILAATKSK